METRKVKVIKEEILILNEKLQKKSLATESFYTWLNKNGFAWRHCILISMFPDGGGTYYGMIVRQDGEVFEFDIDLDFLESSSLVNITNSFHELLNKNKITRPWLKEVIAYDLFFELKNKDE